MTLFASCKSSTDQADVLAALDVDDNHQIARERHPDHDETEFPNRAVLQVETNAQGRGIRELARLGRVYGPGRWRKRKGIARIRFDDGTTCTAELHWYEAHGVGRKELKIKRFIS